MAILADVYGHTSDITYYQVQQSIKIFKVRII